MWSAYLSRKTGQSITLSAKDVCFLNILQKVSRCACGVTEDSVTDIAGYAKNVQLVIDDEDPGNAGDHQ